VSSFTGLDMGNAQDHTAKLGLGSGLLNSTPIFFYVLCCVTLKALSSVLGQVLNGKSSKAGNRERRLGRSSRVSFLCFIFLV
jgi:hypothetical protein